MKLSKLYIEQFRHLENLDFDFTYPSDFHDETKRGKPLEKICFIGQSATGKTSLLELILNDIKAIKNIGILNNDYALWNEERKINSNLHLNLAEHLITTKIYNDENIKKVEVSINNTTLKFLPKGNTSENIFKKYNEKGELFYLKSDIISQKNIDILNTNPLELKEKFKNIILENIENFEFGEEINTLIWLELLYEIIDFHAKRYQKYNELISKGLISDLNRFNAEVQKFLKENPNPVESLSVNFNSIIQKINLEIDLVNTEYPIPVKNKKTNEIIPIQNTSTGTKGLLLSILPIYKLNTQDAIILIDEPERSLYPDIQMDIMETYQKLAPNAQFMVATHSPFIAASFEPEERFILYFNEQGKVAVRRGSSPIGDDPNDILKNDFGLEFLMNKFGIEAFEKFKNLKKEIAIEQNETKKDILLKEIITLANKYKF